MPTIQKINLKNWEEEFDRMTDDEKCIPQETLLYTYKNSK